MTENNFNRQKGEHKIFLLLLLFLAVIVVLFFYTAKYEISQNVSGDSGIVVLKSPVKKPASGKVVLADGATVKIKIGEAEVAAEVVKSDAKKHTGLGGREKLEAGAGMLFVFDSASRYSFWNKDMLFPIDIIWIKDGRAVDISENMPDFKTTPNYTVTPRAEADFVLEVNAGFVKEKNIKIGDEVKL